jgi:hypothetical protein
MQDAETVLDVLNHWRAVMRGNPHVRFGPEAAGKGPAPCRHLAGVLPVPASTTISARSLSLEFRSLTCVACVICVA